MATSNWRPWINGMLAAASAGFVTGTVSVMTGRGDNIKGSLMTGAAGAVTGALIYLKAHPPGVSTPTSAPGEMPKPDPTSPQ